MSNGRWSGVTPRGTCFEPSMAYVVPSAPGKEANRLSKEWFSLMMKMTCLMGHGGPNAHGVATEECGAESPAATAPPADDPPAAMSQAPAINSTAVNAEPRRRPCLLFISLSSLGKILANPQLFSQ